MITKSILTIALIGLTLGVPNVWAKKKQQQAEAAPLSLAGQQLEAQYAKQFEDLKQEILAAVGEDIGEANVTKEKVEITKVTITEEDRKIHLDDKGASAEIMVRDDGHDPDAPPGSAATCLCLGPGWSTVSTTPVRRHKTWTHEGGIATPLIAA